VPRAQLSKVAGAMNDLSEDCSDDCWMKDYSQYFY